MSSLTFLSNQKTKTSPFQFSIKVIGKNSYFYLACNRNRTSSNLIYSNIVIIGQQQTIQEGINYLYSRSLFNYFFKLIFLYSFIFSSLYLQSSQSISLYKRTIMTNLQLTGHTAEVLTLSFNNSTRYLASSGIDKSILIWDCKDSYSNIMNLKSQTNAIISLAWSHTDNLISGSADKTVCNWDLQTGKVMRKYKGHNGIIQNVACPKKTRQLIASVGDDGSLRVWQQRSKQQLRVLQTKYPITSVCFSLNGDKVYFGGIDNDIKCYNIAQQRVEDTIQGHQDTVSSLQISHDGSYLMSNSFDETIRIWDVRSGVQRGKRLSKTMSGHTQGSQKTLIRGCWSRDGLYIASGSIDKCVYIWDTATRKIVQRLGGHSGTVTQVSMGEGNLLASSSNDRSVIVSELPDIFL